VGDAPRDVRPGGAALIEQLLGDVVESEDVAAPDLDRLDRERARLATRSELDDVLAFRGHQLAVELGGEVGKLLADRALAPGLEQAFGRAVDQPHDMILVDRDDAGGDTGQNGLGEGPPRLELGIGLDEVAGLLLEPLGHPIERIA
jgi:hypothetical protein